MHYQRLSYVSDKESEFQLKLHWGANEPYEIIKLIGNDRVNWEVSELNHDCWLRGRGGNGTRSLRVSQ